MSVVFTVKTASHAQAGEILVQYVSIIAGSTHQRHE